MSARSRVAAVVVVAAGSAAGCTTAGAGDPGDGQDPARGGTLNMLGSDDADFLDPGISFHPFGALVARMTSRQLFSHPAVRGHTTEAVPDLAEALPRHGAGISADGKTYTITIRRGVRWDTSPPRQVTADDVVRGIKRTCNPVNPSFGVYNPQSVLEGFEEFCAGFAKVAHTPAAIAAYASSTAVPGIQAVDERTVRFTLRRPATYFADMLTLQTFSAAPKEWDAYLPGSAELNEHFLANGPYTVERYTPDKQIVLRRNPAWDPATDPVRKAYVDRVVIDETYTQDAIQQRLRAGSADADLAFDQVVPLTELPGLVARKDPNLQLDEMSASLPFLVVNTVSPNAGAALTKRAVRQALFHAVDRNSLVQVLGGPRLNPPLTHFLPANLVGGTPDFDPYPHDPARARALLAGAGYPHGLTLTMAHSPLVAESARLVQALQQDLAEAGITLVGKQLSDARWTEVTQDPAATRAGEWDLCLGRWLSDWGGDAAASFFVSLVGGRAAFPPNGPNTGLYEDARTQALIESALDAPTRAEAAERWHAADLQLMSQAAVYPITNPRFPTYHASHVHNAVFLQDFLQLDPTNVWLSPGKQGG